MSQEIPHRWEVEVEQIAQAQHITKNEALDRIIQAGVERLHSLTSSSKPPISYVALFGAIKGPGAHGSKEAVDRYIEDLRNEW